MGLYNFEERFVPFILDGRKRHTIRAIRANPDKPGNTLHLYTGLRHKGARCLIRPVCTKREDILITVSRLVRIDMEWLDEEECELLARADGFESFCDMMEFWVKPKNRLPFSGHIIHWKLPSPRIPMRIRAQR